MIVRRISSLAPLLVALSLSAPAHAETDETLAEVIEILREKGLIDDAQYTELAAKAAAKQKEEEKSWTDRISVWGDFRARMEAFWFHQDVYADSLGVDNHNRYRARYRARLSLRGDVNDYATVYLRLASGDGDPRSTNRTLGTGPYFDKDPVTFDLAYATLTPYPNGELPYLENGYLGVDVGKVLNPFVWRELRADMLLWDNDLTFEGTTLGIKGDLGRVETFFTTGVYIMDENSAAKDPALIGEQFGGLVEVANGIRIGARGSFYQFVSLDQDFLDSAAAGGNIIDGLAPHERLHVIEGGGFVSIGLSELFPALLFATYSKNLSARSSATFPGVGREDQAFSVGAFVGDPRQIVKLGFGYFYIEANAFPSMFIDSDLFDGIPNRAGYAAFLERELLRNVDIAFKLYFGTHRIEGGPAYVDSGLGANRTRGQADLRFKF